MVGVGFTRPYLLPRLLGVWGASVKKGTYNLLLINAKRFLSSDYDLHTELFFSLSRFIVTKTEDFSNSITRLSTHITATQLSGILGTD